jgi:hypothetical protein
MLDAYTKEERFVSSKPGVNYAPNVFGKDKQRVRGFKRPDLIDAMNALFARGAIRNETYGRPSRPHNKIVRVK